MHFKLSETGILSATSQAFVEKDEKILKLLGADHPYWHVDKAIELKSNFSTENRQVLHDNLFKAYSNISAKDPVENKVWQNIEALKNHQTFTVTTGQQLHLFIGPAFVIYKILSVVDFCEDFKKRFPDKHFVPVYWLASEDHDFDEIKSTHIFKKAFNWDIEAKGACGRLPTDRVKEVIDAIRAEISLNDTQQKLLNEFESIYATSGSLSEASRRVINKFFGALGVVVIDADAPEFKQIFKPVIENDLFNNDNQLAFEEVSKSLEQEGLSTQLNGRAINLFYLTDQRRTRIIQDGEDYTVTEGTERWTKEEIKQAFETHPERFSPNAMLRPLFQESILPNIAYVGGNAEVTYWIQLHKTMSINNLSCPALILRPSVWITPSKITQWLDKRAITPLKVLITREKTHLLNLIQTETLGIEAETQAFFKLREKIQTTVAQNISKELKGIVEAGKQYEKALKTIEKALRENQIEKHAKEIDKLEEIRDTYLNINNIQERKTDSLELLIKHENVVFTIKSAVSLNNSDGWIINM